MYVVQRHIGVQRRQCTWSRITLDWLCSAYGNDKKTREWKNHLLCPLQRYTTNQNLNSCTCSTSNMFFKRIMAYLIRYTIPRILWFYELCCLRSLEETQSQRPSQSPSLPVSSLPVPSGRYQRRKGSLVYHPSLWSLPLPETEGGGQPFLWCQNPDCWVIPIFDLCPNWPAEIVILVPEERA